MEGKVSAMTKKKSHKRQNFQKLVYDLTLPELTVSEEISAQIRGESDTYPIGYSDLFFMKGGALK